MRQSDIERFLTKYQVQDNDCWEWQDYIGKLGYGYFNINSDPVLAHRFSATIHFGDIPPGHHVHHRCSNRRCINPQHLEVIDRTQHLLLHGNKPAAPCPHGFVATSQQRCNLCEAKRKRDGWKAASPKTSAYTGVTFDRYNQSWEAAIYVRGQKVFIGRYKDEYEAAYVRDQAALQVLGEVPTLNVM